jgi:hypothetical protein
MTRSEFLDLLMLPIGITVEYKLFFWPLLATLFIWLLIKKFSPLNGMAPVLSFWVWSLVLSFAFISALCIFLLYLFSPKGPDFYRIVLAFFGGLPFLIVGTISLFLKPQS